MNVGYCTNIHSGVSFDQALANLQEFSLPVKRAVSPDEPMGIGLWFSQEAVTEALQSDNLGQLKECLDANGLVAHTFNAFPFSDFHQSVVKHAVYQPDWTTRERLQYTLDVARLQSILLPAGSLGTISTVPLAWRDPTRQLFKRCTPFLSECAAGLQQLHESTGVKIRLCLEPEPGCALQTSAQVVELFGQHLLADPATENTNREYLGVCHDVCHAAVMFEPQQEVLARYHDVGIAIGKVQISSAPEWRPEHQEAGLEALRSFVEPRYLHQTSIRTSAGQHFFEDLPLALENAATFGSESIWRTHFHVPVMIQEIDHRLATTHEDIGECLSWFLSRNYASHFEIETYAWEVSPRSIQGGTMVDSIAAELLWLRQGFPGLANLNIACW